MAWRIRPSGAATWSICPGSVVMQEKYPDDDGPEAMEGTAAHWVASELLRNIMASAGTIAPNGVVVTAEMVEHAKHYVGIIRETGLSVWVEQGIGNGAIHTECGGTPDAWTVDYQKRIIYVYDYKYGHKYIDVYRNRQLICYVANIMKELGIDRSIAGGWTIIFTIVQPRCYLSNEGVVKRWKFIPSSIEQDIAELGTMAAEAVGENPICIAGTHCDFCTARHACDAHLKAASHAIAISGQAVPFELSPAAVGRELQMLHEAQKILAARISGLEVQAVSMVRSGKRVTGWELESKPGRMVWREGMKEQIIGLGMLYGVDLQKTPEPITPTQAIAAGVDPTVINEYAFRPPGEAKLTRVDLTKTQRIFSD